MSTGGVIGMVTFTEKIVKDDVLVSLTKAS